MDTPRSLLGQIVYEQVVDADRGPNDLDWALLPDHIREGWMQIAEHVVRHYEVLMGLPEASL